MTKTNVMRLLDSAKIPYRTAEYAYDENDLGGMHAAAGIGMPPEQIFKPLVARGEKRGFLVFCIPVCAGCRGCQILLAPDALIDYVNMSLCDLTE